MGNATRLRTGSPAPVRQDHFLSHILPEAAEWVSTVGYPAVPPPHRSPYR